MRAFEFLDKFDTLNSKTMVIDKGLGSSHVEDMLKVNGDYFNFIKYGWGTSILCDDKIVQEKNEIYESYNIKSYTGGTLFELDIHNVFINYVGVYYRPHRNNNQHRDQAPCGL